MPIKNFMSLKLLITSLVALCVVPHSSFSQSQFNQTINLIVSTSTPIIENFSGFGVEWDSRGYNENNVTNDDFLLIAERIKWMRLPIVRIMMQTKWCYSGSGGFDWNNDNMKSLYRQLDFCNKNGIDVILTDWGIEVDWLKVEGITGMDDQKYADVIGEYLDYFVNKKGYHCIKYFTLVNEPNFEVDNFETWFTGVINVYYELRVRKLNNKMKFMGPGQSNNNTWLFDAVQRLNHVFEGYDSHLYAWKETTAKGSVYFDIGALWNYARKNDPNFDHKMYFVTEAGMRDGQSADISTNIDSFEYGVFMADYAIQAVHAGSNAVLAWMLDDNSHPNFKWGLWTDKKSGMKFRPWFYSWSLLSRLFERESEIYKIRSRSIYVRAMGAKFHKNGKTGWSFCVVNLDANPVPITFKVENESDYKFNCYTYSESNTQKDSKGFPFPDRCISANLSEGINYEVPANSVIFITSFDFD